MHVEPDIENAKQALRLYDVVDEINKKMGKHTVYLASSMRANVDGLHQGERGDSPAEEVGPVSRRNQKEAGGNTDVHRRGFLRARIRMLALFAQTIVVDSDLPRHMMGMYFQDKFTQ